MTGKRTSTGRRNFLKGAGLAAVGSAGLGALPSAAFGAHGVASAGRDSEPFYGVHQGGIVTPQQRHSYFAVFDLTTARRDDVVALLKAWTVAAAQLADGKAVSAAPAVSAPPATAPTADGYGAAATSDAPPPVSQDDTGETEGVAPQRLTITFGFGPGLFSKDGHDRFGLASARPEALIDPPKFAGDQLAEAQTGGDLSVQACADDPQVAFHAVRQLARIADGTAQIRWVQSGFLPAARDAETPRNLMGFKDGTGNPKGADRTAMDTHIWAGREAPAWMQGGSYLVARRIRIALEHWDRMAAGFQEQTIGRHKHSGAPLGCAREHDAIPLDAADKDGNPVIAQNAHVRLAAAASNGGTQILRRGYSYNDGLNFVAERWPPWRQGLEYDAGLFFLCYQRDPRTGFVKIFERMAKFDMLNQFATHTGGGLFACPRGAAPGEYIGQRLFEA